LAYLAVIIATGCAAILETAWPQPLFWGGERPELMLATTMSLGLVFGLRWGMVGGFLAALWRGALLEEPWGGLFVAYGLVGVLAGSVGYRLLVRRTSAAWPTALLASALFRAVCAFFQPPPAFGLWLGGLARAALYTALLALPVHAFALWVDARLEQAQTRWR
jgi:hypothetical protein